MPLWLDYKRADRAPTVLIQEALTKQGYAPGPADGRFGLQTLRAVAAFQTAHDLKPTGGVDEGLYASIVAGKKPRKAKAKAEDEAPTKTPPAAKKAAATTPTTTTPAATIPPATKKPAAKKAAAKKAAS
jgi:peptidoglycan hydrolase-like protein with peptidoglycan-binding domain